jgi:hypothetical protein
VVSPSADSGLIRPGTFAPFAILAAPGVAGKIIWLV